MCDKKKLKTRSQDWHLSSSSDKIISKKLSILYLYFVHTTIPTLQLFTLSLPLSHIRTHQRFIFDSSTFIIINPTISFSSFSSFDHFYLSPFFLIFSQLKPRILITTKMESIKEKSKERLVLLFLFLGRIETPLPC